ncbi:purine and uridine phosphorylase [Zopfia rhizophila CBS 207.26]|uniref:Purine and uridine phosphorylase n=1 Tax=Zopfia rhizophila CBS 207.26 TaxID=1314779 RepID=A0A6A6DPE5_9PEZI|nr:purine and uridine phosphorylase [Zopfia rhizophila CBS 207.26]
MTRQLRREDYTVGWMCALPVELAAAQEMLDEEHGSPQRYKNDENLYHLGSIAGHNVVIVCLPAGRIGNNPAAAVATQAKATFQGIQFGLMVGVGGGVPGASADIRLGDVVVSQPDGTFGGVVQYDSGKATLSGFERIGSLNSPPQILLMAVASVQANEHRGRSKVSKHIARLNQVPKFQRNKAGVDVLFEVAYDHEGGHTCDKCKTDKQETRQPRKSEEEVVIHYGIIASGNKVIKNAAERDRVSADLGGVFCFEMEAAGLMNNFPCLVIRGICDYSDSHKNKKWQPYAAAAAAAYAKEVLSVIPPTNAANSSMVDDEAIRGTSEYLVCVQHLRSTDPRDDKKRIEETKGGLLKDSYRWILENPDFQQWRDHEQSQLLWIKGDPGKGKTMLLCGIIDELQNMLAPNTDPLSYFFCQATDSRINNPTAVLRGLLYMLVDQQPWLISHIRKKHEHAGKALFEDANAWVALCEILTSILQDPSLNSTYLIVDALDECVMDLAKLLDFIVRMTSLSSHVKWIISSRNETHIEQRLRLDNSGIRLSLELKENAAQVSYAVNAYIEHCLSELPEIEHDTLLQELVRKKIQQKANGTFLWVSLVIKELKNVMAWEILQILDEIPTELKEVYRRMMKQIKQLQRQYPELCRQVLSTVLATYRPLHLQELYFLSGLSIQVQNINQATAAIVKMCGSFLTIREDDVYIIHQSARDFLSKEVRQDIFPCGAGDVHQSIFCRSLQVMSRTLRRDMYSLRTLGYSIDQVKQPDLDPLVASRYSCIYWIDHLYEWNTSSSAKDKVDLQDGGVVHSFLRQQYLYWLEALSLCKNMPKGVVSMAKLEALIQEQSGTSTILEHMLPHLYSAQLVA